jgi:CRISPR-associated protein Csb1
VSSASRHIYDVDLAPVLGSVFQPTGFPDLGAATFQRHRGDQSLQECLLVESVQSMANRLEATAWDAGANRQAEVLDGLPYLEVVAADDGRFLTSSRLEAHRVFSAFVRDADWNGSPGDQVLLERLGMRADTPLDYRAMAGAVMALDPLSLLHGVFFAGGKAKAKSARGDWPAQPKFARAVSSVIEAYDVSRVVSGGRKSDQVRHRLDEDREGGAAEGYGSVPFQRTEWTAGRIAASFVVDRQLIASYGLPAPAGELLETIALWEIRSLLDNGLRLRTACDLEPVGAVTTRRGDPLPELDDLTSRLRTLIPACVDSLGEGKPVTLTWSAKAAAK